MTLAPASAIKAPLFSICVYCGSRPGNSLAFAAVARTVGTWIGTHGGELVYGGGRNGLMGVVADATLAAGGQVYGVIPQALVDKECAHTGCTELHIVNTMHERKRMMAERADAFLALPGGIGTLEELFEVWTWRQLGYHDKPIALLDTAGYFKSLLAFLTQAVESEFMTPKLMELVMNGAEPEPLLAALVDAVTHKPGATRLGLI